MNKRYYSLEKTENEANINIYGDITSWAWEEQGEMSAVNLSKQLDALGDVSKINVYINSYGGEVAEGLAIYNALKRHKAKVVTYCDGFACSIASVIFMAGDERVMNDSSLLMIHNAWTMAIGNADDLRKQADDLEKITQASVIAYEAHSTLSEKEIKALMDNETWILPEEAVEYGFATSIAKTETTKASQSVKKWLLDIIKAHQKADTTETDGEEEETKKDTETDTEDGGEDPDNNSEETEEASPETDDEEKPETKDTDGDEEKEPAEKFSGFFEAILKM